MSEDTREKLGTCDLGNCSYPGAVHFGAHRMYGNCVAWAPLPSSEGTVKSEPDPQLNPCACVCHKVGLFGLMCCPCTVKALDELVNGKATEPQPPSVPLKSETNMGNMGNSDQVVKLTEEMTMTRQFTRNAIAGQKVRTVENRTSSVIASGVPIGRQLKMHGSSPTRKILPRSRVRQSQQKPPSHKRSVVSPSNSIDCVLRCCVIAKKDIKRNVIQA